MFFLKEAIKSADLKVSGREFQSSTAARAQSLSVFSLM